MLNLSSIIYKLISMLMSILLSTGAIALPSADEPINQAMSGTYMSFIALGDTQVCNYNPTREKALIASVEDISNSSCPVNALVVAGDIAENGFQDEYDRVYDDLKKTGIKNFIFSAGNHDIRLRDYEQCSERFLNLQNSLNPADKAVDKLYYTYKVNGCTFIVMASERSDFEDATITIRQTKWLKEQLDIAAVDGKPVFVVLHYPLKDTHGLPDTWSNSLWESGSIGDDSDTVLEILNEYDNVILITGHLHTGFGQFSYEKIGNIDSVNVPSIGIKNKDGDYNDNGTGYFVEVSPSQVLFRARDFAKGKFLPDYDITIDLK